MPDRPTSRRRVAHPFEVVWRRLAQLAAGGLVAAVAISACSPLDPPGKAPSPVITVFAAASLTDVLSRIAADYESVSGRTVRLSFAASGSVARQVESGAPADVVVLADPPWMDRLVEARRIAAASRIDLVGNRLVLITGAGTAIEGDPVAWLVRSGGRLAIGDPESVPAGTYARTWLQGTGQWEAVEPRLVTGADVRAVRTFVSRGEAALGVVYRSDVFGASGIRIVAEPPQTEQPRIVYPAALTADAVSGADEFLRYLRSPEAVDIFRRQGFEPQP